MSVTVYIIAAVCILSVVIGLSGNLTIVVVRIFKQIQRRNTTAYTFLICQLAIADFIFAVTIIFDIHVLLHNDEWLFGSATCKFVKTLQSTSLSTTAGLLMLMSYERYCGLSKPFHPRWSIRKTSVVVVVIWFYIIVTFIPFMIAVDVKDGQCAEYNHSSETFRKAYTLFLFITNYMLPLLSIIVFHTLIVIKTRSHIRSMGTNARHKGSYNSVSESPHKQKEESHSEQENNNDNCSEIPASPVDLHKQKENTGCLELLRKVFNKEPSESCSPNSPRALLTPTSPAVKSNNLTIRQRFARLRSRDYEDQKLVKMLVTVALCFAIMTLPTQLWYIWYDFGGGHKINSKAALHILEVFASLIYMHCCANCIIYSAMDKKFRTDVKVMLGCMMNPRSFKARSRMTHLTVVSQRSARKSNNSPPTNKSNNSSPTNKTKDTCVVEKETVLL